MAGVKAAELIVMCFMLLQGKANILSTHFTTEKATAMC